MRHHFHRCMNLRVVYLPAPALHGARRGGGGALEELCEARRLTPCVGLEECDVLTAGQKRELLIERATRIREVVGRPTELSGVARSRAAEIDALREELVRERDAIVDENLRLEAEIAAAEDRGLAAGRAEEAELGAAGIAPAREPAGSLLRIDRLDEIDRTLDAMHDVLYGSCALCGGDIAIERLRLYAETRVCTGCAREAPGSRPIEPREEQPSLARHPHALRP